MTLPDFLLNKIEFELNRYPLKDLRAAYEELSGFYRTQRESIHLSLDSAHKRLAYIAARMPATYAAVANVLQEIPNKDDVISVLDVGAGCGTASFAAAEIMNNLNKVTLIEQNKEMIKLGQKLANEHSLLKEANWFCENILLNQTVFTPHDVVILSYSLNEIKPELQQQIILKLWDVTNKYLIIVEPGTQASFQIIHSLRSLFISRNEVLLSPCSHSNTCPAFATGDWCHFFSRVQRTSFHKYLKQGERGFEDEKYSYLILSKTPKVNYSARIVREPVKRSGFISLKLCSEEGFLNKIFTKKDKTVYNALKDSEWGDKVDSLPSGERQNFSMT